MRQQFIVSLCTSAMVELRYQDVSLSGIFAPPSESSQWEPLLPGTKVPGNFCSWERRFPGTFVPGSECSPELFVACIVSSLSDHGKGCWHCSEIKSKKI